MNYSIGKNSDFYWIETASSDFDLIKLVKEAPNLLINKYLGIVCFDGGVFTPNDKELNRGWYKKNTISFSPVLNQNELDNSIYENYDQWCLFNGKTEFTQMTDFVNYTGFRLNTEIGDKSLESLQKKFWIEVKTINPHGVIINGDFFIYCTKEENEINNIITIVNNNPSN